MCLVSGVYFNGLWSAEKATILRRDGLTVTDAFHEMIRSVGSPLLNNLVQRPQSSIFELKSLLISAISLYFALEFEDELARITS
jgi:hypothetical protein